MVPLESIRSYLTSRGITPELANKYGLRAITVSEAEERLEFKQGNLKKYSAGILIPGNDFYGKKTDYCQVILFSQGNGFIPVTRRRYSRPGPNEAIYLPGTDWAGYSGPVVVAESYIKAVIAQETLKVPAIALNGVHGFSGCKSLDKLPWRDRTMDVTVIYDSLNKVNKKSRDMVELAQRRCASFFNVRYKIQARIAQLPPPADEALEDWGLDDFVASGGDLKAVYDSAISVDVNQTATALDWYNSRFAVVKSLSAVYEFDTHIVHSYTNFPKTFAIDQHQNAEGELVPTSRVWFNWDKRTTLLRPCFRPGEDRVVGGNLNIWRGLATEPAEDSEGVEENWVGVIREALGSHTDRDIAHFLDSLAAVVQTPGVKHSQWMHIYGAFGTGKNYVLSPIRTALGEYHAPATNAQRYIQKFNAEKARARLIVINETDEDGLDSREQALFEEELKRDSDAGEAYRDIEFKGKDKQSIERCCLVVALSNRFAPLVRIRPGDRRCFALHFSDAMAIKTLDRPWGGKSEEWWADRWEWMNNGGAERVLKWLLSRQISADLSAAPPVTGYLRQIMMSMMEDGYKGFAEMLKSEPSACLTYRGIDLSESPLFPIDLLLRIHHQNEPNFEITDGRKNAMGQALTNIGIVGKVVKWKGDTLRCRFLRPTTDPQKWLEWISGKIASDAGTGQVRKW